MSKSPSFSGQSAGVGIRPLAPTPRTRRRQLAHRRAARPGERAPSVGRRLCGIGIVVAVSAAFLAFRDRPPTAATSRRCGNPYPQFRRRRGVRRLPCARSRRHGTARSTTSRCRSPTTSRCSAISTARSSAMPGIDVDVLQARRQVLRQHRWSGRQARDYEIKYTFGVAPLQQYLIELPGGRMQALGIAWDSRPKEKGGQRWFHLYPGQNIKAGDPLHWTGIGQNWNYQCAECHSTNLRKNFDAATGTFKTTWSELNVSCEACHGPGSNHVAWAKRKAPTGRRSTVRARACRSRSTSAAASTWVPDRRDRQRGAASLARTSRGNRHVRAVPRPRGPAHRRLRARQAAGRFAPDGDARRGPVLERRPDARRGVQLGFVRAEPDVRRGRHVLGLPRSAHAEAARRDGNAVCAQCHQPAKYDVAAHTHHAEGTPGAACVACHMPTTTYMVVDPRHDHSLRIPRPDLSAKLGTPNACNQCHANAVVAMGRGRARQVGRKDAGRLPALCRGPGRGHGGGAGRARRVARDHRRRDAAGNRARQRACATRPVADADPPGCGFAGDSTIRIPRCARRPSMRLRTRSLAVRQRYLPRMLDDPGTRRAHRRRARAGR